MTLAFASNYTSMLVALHNVFNGSPRGLGATLGQMYALHGMAIELMQMADPRQGSSAVGIGPTWEYVPAASQYTSRGGRARAF